MKCELDLLFQDHPQRFVDFNMWFLFLYFFSLMHSKPCFYLTCSAFLFVSISNAYGRSGKHKPVGMWWNTVWWNYLITSAHLSMPLRWDAQKHIPPSPRWLSEELHVLHSPSPVLKWYKILMSALWISFSWNLAKALKVCELGDMHEKENRKMRWRQEASLMKYIPVMEKKERRHTMHGLYFGICMYIL